MTSEQFWKSVDSTKIMNSKLLVNFVSDDDPVIRPPLSPSVNQEQNAVKDQAWDKPSIAVKDQEWDKPSIAVKDQEWDKPSSSRVTNKVYFSYFNFLTLVK